MFLNFSVCTCVCLRGCAREVRVRIRIRIRVGPPWLFVSFKETKTDKSGYVSFKETGEKFQTVNEK